MELAQIKPGSNSYKLKSEIEEYYVLYLRDKNAKSFLTI